MEKEQIEQNVRRFDLEKRQKNAFEAAVENAKMANEAIKSSQNWLLLLGLAEMSFLGMILLRRELISIFWIKILIIILLIAFILFILGSILQYKHLLRGARIYGTISDKAIDYLNKGERFVDNIPEELKLPAKQIVSSKLVNHLFFGSYVLVILATIGIIFLVIKA